MFCAWKLSWKKSTTYTVLKKLIEKGIFQNEQAVVTSKISRDEFYGLQSQKYVEETFGSLPQFLTAFFQGKKLSAEDGKGSVEDLRGREPSVGDEWTGEIAV